MIVKTMGVYDPQYHNKTYSYKAMYENQVKTNKGILIALGIVSVVAITTLVGTIERYRAELKASDASYIKCSNAYRTAEASYNDVVNILVNPDPQSVDSIINSVFGKDAPIMREVARCESGFNPKARNKTSSARGLFQVMSSVHQVQEKWLLNPTINTLIAKQLYDEQGLTPWISSRECWSK